MSKRTRTRNYIQRHNLQRESNTLLSVVFRLLSICLSVCVKRKANDPQPPLPTRQPPGSWRFGQTARAENEAMVDVPETWISSEGVSFLPLSPTSPTLSLLLSNLSFYFL
eukprot:TRINITY_DN12229_c0_g2_i1.p1 TRINITY_DN12229_c0_g2~~TRINITY_DN12229_c0_g2_i1.p1  ORF type:complete len:110 (-),score=6.40 TRINITY_DN12229_c0_g2_i1:198-527(-)